MNELLALGVEPAELLSTWEYYLQNENARFVSPQSFDMKYGTWQQRAAGQRERNGDWHVSMNALLDWARA